VISLTDFLYAPSGPRLAPRAKRPAYNAVNMVESSLRAGRAKGKIGHDSQSCPADNQLPISRQEEKR
jgi:hypothetical protein